MRALDKFGLPILVLHACSKNSYLDIIVTYSISNRARPLVAMVMTPKNQIDIVLQQEGFYILLKQRSDLSTSYDCDLYDSYSLIGNLAGIVAAVHVHRTVSCKYQPRGLGSVID